MAGSRRLIGATGSSASWRRLYSDIRVSLWRRWLATARGDRGEHAGELLDALGDGRLGLVQHERQALVDRAGDDDVAWDEGVGLHLQRALHLTDVELDLGVGPVEDELE